MVRNTKRKPPKTGYDGLAGKDLEAAVEIGEAIESRRFTPMNAAQLLDLAETRQEREAALDRITRLVAEGAWRP